MLDGEDLLDDVLTAPAAAPPRSFRTTNEDEVRALVRLQRQERGGEVFVSAQSKVKASQACLLYLTSLY